MVWESKERIKEPSIVGGSYPKMMISINNFKNKWWVDKHNLQKELTFFSPHFYSKKDALAYAKEWMEKH